MKDKSDTALLGGPSSSSFQKMTVQRKIVIILGIALVIAIVVIGISIAIYYNMEDDKKAGLSDTLEVQNIMGHLQELNRVADNDWNGSRSVLDGYNRSAQYVMDQLKATNDFCTIQTQSFNVPVYEQLSAPTLSQNTPLNVSYVLGRDFSGTRYGGNGVYDITAPIVVAANFGCNFPEDFQSGTFNNSIAVVFDGNCTQYQKALNAEQAGAWAILIVNGKGNALANWRVRSVQWNESSPLIQIPVLGITYSLGLTFQQQPETVLHITTNTQVVIAQTFNVFCLTVSGSANDIMVVGAHLDSVPEGPGINDNGSGSASILEIALEIARRQLKFTSKILFAWWGAEEIGLLGSRYFVNQLVAQSQPGYNLPAFSQNDYLPALFENNTLLGLNFDMLGSPNYVRQVYTCTMQSPRVNNASFQIQQFFEEYFNDRNTYYEILEMTGGSDFLPFIENGWAAGALATGAGAIKTVAERETFGGFANAPLDPCYHLSCDTTANIAVDVLEDMSKAAAYTVQQLASQSNLREFLYGPQN